MGIPLKTADQIELMRESCRVTSTVLDELISFVKPGISTVDIDEHCRKRITEMGGVPSPLNYKGYPKSICTSVNDVICHGIPRTDDILKSGDIVNIDVTTYKGGFHGDSSRMYYVGGRENCSEETVQLVETTKKALYIGIATVKPGNYMGDIGSAIQEYIKSTGFDYGIVREYTGHGIGKDFHEPPQVLHFGKAKSGALMKPGMTFTIEPMINAGGYKTVLSPSDGWTVRTADGSLSAQWEHTILVTDDGYEILTESNMF